MWCEEKLSCLSDAWLQWRSITTCGQPRSTLDMMRRDEPLTNASTGAAFCGSGDLMMVSTWANGDLDLLKPIGLSIFDSLIIR
jgi:hypothetical protein